MGRSVDTEERIALVAATWTATQRLHPGNVAWHGSGCDGAPPEHERKGLSRCVCRAVMSGARDIGASTAVVGPRGDNAYPVPRQLYASMGFRTVGRTEALTWA
ncbi:hypothetical protein GCM10011492_38860 [Flexivirga endophytica]|uniref:Uncharacterized protein n=1 Tax=Flexivirga endophytica TaxID=1849103 RepID=A0A916X034_9MICO|nr:hypothetical protein GCM10011492_38860 [Flexivirga endophytica]GHB59914.1 hypothetical protein GCM10008112_31060 [Flexivirga endophytica]